MRETLLLALAAFGVSLAVVPLCRGIALRFGVVATPRADRWHGRPTALLGGAAIALTSLALHVAFVGVTALPVLLLGGGAMFLIGLVDDIRSLTPTTKLVSVIAVASFFVFFGYRLSWTSSLVLDTLLTVLWIVGLTNAFNLLDNMDGLCAGLALIAGGGIMATLAADGLPDAQRAHLALLMGATAGFLVYNFHPASIFMGDSGSLFLGLNLAVLTLDSPFYARASSASLLSIMAGPALILLVPILDTTLVTVSRVISGRSAAQGGRDHSSHRLVAIGLSERSAVFVLWALAALGGLLALSLNAYGDGLTGIAAALFAIAAILFTVYLAQVRVYDDERAVTWNNRITPVVVNFVYRRRLAEVFLDLWLVAIAYYGAYRLRFGDEFRSYFPLLLESLPLVIGVQLLSLSFVGGYRGFWRYFGMMDGVIFAKGVLLGTVLNVGLLVYVYRFEDYSRGVFVVYAALLLILLAGTRASFRLISEFAHRRSQQGMRVVIYGIGDVAASAVRHVLTRRSGGYRMLGFIADDRSMARAQIQGYGILGDYEALVALVRGGSVDLVVLTQSVSPERLEALRQLCVDRQVSLERLQLGLDTIVSGS